MYLDPASALRRYEEVRDRLPAADFPAETEEIADLSALIGRVDVFVLDAFGVLNVGDTPIPGARERVAAFRAAGKRVLVLSNSATYPKARTVEKLNRIGFDFCRDEVISSRDALVYALAQENPDLLWGVAAARGSEFGELARRTLALADDPADYDRADGFVLLSSAEWTEARQDLLCRALDQRSRRLIVGNPDLVAPREGGLSPEPGLYAHDAQDRTGTTAEFHGKPFPGIYALARARLGGTTAEGLRMAMVGDTLHTDVLGGASQGWTTVLVQAHGLMRGFDLEAAIAATGIRPHFVATTV